MSPAKSNAHKKAQDVQRHIADGRIFINVYEPRWPDKSHYTSGGILIPDTAVSGAAVKDNNDNIKKPDKQSVFGVVIACGRMVERTTLVPLKGDDATPLPKGSLVKVIQTSVDWQVAPGQMAYNTYDIQEWLLPGEELEPSIWGENPPL